MLSRVENLEYTKHVLEVLTFGLKTGSFSDVLIHVPNSKKSIKCHKSILLLSSPFLHQLISDHDDTDEPLHIVLTDIEYDDVMAMLNIVYVGKIICHLSHSQQQRMINFLSEYFGIKINPEDIIPVNTPRIDTKDKTVKKSRIFSKPFRPLRVKNAPSSGACMIVLAPESSAGPIKRGEEVLSSYQRAKQKCADKFKCQICNKGFPLTCLLRRHERSHSSNKPFPCLYCDKSFRSRISFNNHNFMKHAEERLMGTSKEDTVIGVISKQNNSGKEIEDAGKDVGKNEETYNINVGVENIRWSLM